MAILGAKTFQNYIDGEWVDAASGETFESTSPANGDAIGVFPRSSAEDVERAVAAAKSAYEDWRLVPAPKRGELLFRFAHLLSEQKEDLAQLMAHEMGKVLPEARGDVQEAIDMAYYMGGEGRRLFGQTTPSELRDKFNMSVRAADRGRRRDHAVELPDRDPELEDRCPRSSAATRSSSSRPPTLRRSASASSSCSIEAGVPAGVVNIVHGGGAQVGDALVRHPDVPVISLTGSRETGVEVTKTGADRLKHIHLELGGKNAIIVMDDADLDLAVEGIVWSAFGTSGQRCTAASRVIAHEAVYDELASRVVKAAERLRLGVGWEEDTDVGPVINQAALEKIDSYTAIGRDEGASLLTGGEVASGNGLDKGFYYRPTVFGDVDPGMRIAQEEIFGPTVAVIKVRDVDEAIEVSNGIKYGLSSSIFTQDVNRAFRAMRDLKAGITYINAGTIGAEVHLPFGGVKDTGNGHREAGQAALDFFTEWKSIYVDYSGKLQKAQIDA